MRETISSSALVVAMVIAACRGHGLAAGVDDSTFVAAMAALHRVNQNVSVDSASASQTRDSVLQSRGLTAEQLAAAASALADDPDRAVAVWARVLRAERGEPSGDDTARAVR